MPTREVMQNQRLAGVLAGKGDMPRLVPVLVATLLALFVAAPWLQAGYLFGTDWPAPRVFALPSEISSSVPFQLALAAISRIVGPEATGKILVLAILVGGAFAAYRAVPTDGFPGRAAAATLYMANPFVFGRLHYGQLYLLAAYVLLPWIATCLRKVCAEPTWTAGLLFALSVSVVGVFSAHLFLVALVMTVVVVVAHIALSGD